MDEVYYKQLFSSSHESIVKYFRNTYENIVIYANMIQLKEKLEKKECEQPNDFYFEIIEKFSWMNKNILDFIKVHKITKRNLEQLETKLCDIFDPIYIYKLLFNCK